MPPTDYNDTVYEVLYQPLVTFDAGVSNGSVVVANVSVLLSDLEEFAEYAISVRAVHGDSRGSYSEEVIVRTSEDGELIVPQILLNYK